MTREEIDKLIETVKKDALALQYAGEEARNNPEIVLEAVKKNSNALEYAGEEARNNPEIVLEAVKKNGIALYYAGEEARNNPEIVLEAVKKNGIALRYAGEEARNNPEIVLEAVKKNSDALQYAGKEARNNPEIVLEAVKKNSDALYYAGEEARNNPEIVLEAVKKNGYALKLASEELKNNPEFVLEAIKIDFRTLEFASEGLKNNPEFVLEAIKIEPQTLGFVSEELKNNPEIVLEAIKADVSTMVFAGKEVENNIDIIREAVEINENVLRYISYEMQSSIELNLFLLEKAKEQTNLPPQGIDRWALLYFSDFVKSMTSSRRNEIFDIINPRFDEIVKKNAHCKGKNNLEELKSTILLYAEDSCYDEDEEWHFQNEMDYEYFEKYLKEANKMIELWVKQGFIPSSKLFLKIGKVPERIAKFDTKLWFKLAREPVFNITEESKMALVELAYCFGVFDKDKVELRGKGKDESSLTNEERRSGQVENYQNRMQTILDMVHSGELTNENLHMMFDGTNMEFDPAFYRFFIDNKDKIFSDESLMRRIPDIQQSMPRIIEKFRGNIPTIEQCMRYFEERSYFEIRKGNEQLAKLCHLSGVSEERFNKYQDLFALQKERSKENTIPRLLGKSYEILRLTDPKILVDGEGKFSKCCQRMDAAGEDCMRHAATSQNGRLVEIYDNNGRFIAQSWIWRNGNVVCFDSIEANALENDTDAEKEENIKLIVSTYKMIAEDMIAESIKKVDEYRKEKLEEIEKEEISDDEKIRKIARLDKICEESKIKRVTVGKGYWPISKKITAHFSNRPVDDSKGRVYPRENVSYISDSNIQFVVAEIDGLKEEEIQTDSANVEVKYRDERRIIQENGEEIESDTVHKIKQIESEAHKESMKEMKEAHSVFDLADIYEVDPQNLRIIHGEDWYYIYSNEESIIHILDLARGTPRFEDEKVSGSSEMGKALDRIMLESIDEDKIIAAELREDTSYLLLLELKEAGLVEQVGDDEVFEYGNDSEVEYISEEEQKELLERKEEIRKKEANGESTLMHHIRFLPTEKYKRILKRRYTKNVEGVGENNESR